MEKQELRVQLTASLAQMYDKQAFSSFAEFLQGELHVLQFLSQNTHSEINPSILSDKLHVSRSRMTAALSTLRKKGYITMLIAEHDRRRMRVLLTPEGENFIKQKQKKFADHFDALIEGLGKKNACELIRLINLCVKIVDMNFEQKTKNRIGEQ